MPESITGISPPLADVPPVPWRGFCRPSPSAGTQKLGGRLEKVLFAAVVLLALVVRLGYLLQIKDSAVFSVLLGDSLAYDEWAHRIAQGDWLGKDVFFQAPLYPYFLAGIHYLVGHNLLVVRLVQCALGALACGFLVLAGNRFFSIRVGLLAGVLLALYGPAVFYDGLIQKTVLDGFLVCLCLFLLGSMLHRMEIPRFPLFVMGLVLGCLSLSRENALVLVAAVGVWLWWHWQSDHLRTRLEGLAAFLLGCALVIAPVTIRNYWIGQEWFLTTAQFGYNLYIGNNEKADGLYRPLRFGHGNAAVERQDTVEMAEQALGRKLTAGEVSAYWRSQAVAWISTHPAAWTRLLLKKGLLVWNAKELIDTDEPEVYADDAWILRTLMALVNFGTVAPLAVLGIWATWAERRRLWILYLFLLVTTVSIALFYVFGRYRYSFVPILVLFAAAAVFKSFEWVQQRNIRMCVFALAFLLSTAYVVHITWFQDDVPRLTTYYNLGVRLAERRDFEGAVREYRKALAINPNVPDVRINLATALFALQQVGEATEHYRAAVRLSPSNGTFHFHLGLALIKQENPREALTHFQRAVELDPAMTEARAQLAMTEAALQMPR